MALNAVAGLLVLGESLSQGKPLFTLHTLDLTVSSSLVLQGLELTESLVTNTAYARNQSGCKNAKKVGFLPSLLWVFLTIYICVALMKLTMCFKQLKASHIISWDS